MNKIVLLFLAAIFLTACGGTPTPTQPPEGPTPGPDPLLSQGQPAPLTFIDWKLAVIDGVAVDPGVSATVSFGDASISGNGGCNEFSGGYSVTGGTLTVIDLVSTDMACQEPIMSTEIQYLAALASGGTLTATRDTLEIKTADGPILRFVEQ